jgi:hypothetical protein
MSRSRSRLMLAVFVAAVVAMSGIGAVQAHENRATRVRSASIRTPRGVVGAGRHILIYKPTLNDKKAINEASVARRLGFHVKVATRAEWSAMTQEQFGNFSLVLFGDPGCKDSTDRLDAALANQDVWSAAIDGNVVVSAFDAVWHANKGIRPGPERLIANSIRFTGLGVGTGLDVNLSCYYAASTSTPPGTPVELLAGIGSFTVTGQSEPPVPGCPNHFLLPAPDHPLVARLSAKQLSDWDCSAHAAFDGVEAGFDAVANLKKSGLPVLVAREAA